MEVTTDDLLERFSIMTIDGGLSDADAIKSIREIHPQTLKNGVYSDFLAKIGIKPDPAENAPKSADFNAMGNTEQKEKAARPDFGTLKQYLDYGFTLYTHKPFAHQEQNKDTGVMEWKTDYIPCDWQHKKFYGKKEDFITAKEKDGNANAAIIRTAAELEQAIKNGIHNFQFKPSERGFLCIDIDSGHKNGVDGLQVFNDYFVKKGIAYNFFNPESVYTDTPSGGRHLYYNAEWAKIDRYLTDFLQNVEIRGAGNSKKLTAAGSIKNNRFYSLHGKIKDAPKLPNMLIKHITPAPIAKPQGNAGQHQYKRAGGYTLAKLIDFVIADNAGAGRNDTAYRIGFRIGGQFNIESIVQECRGREPFLNFPESELRTAIASGIKNSRH